MTVIRAVANMVKANCVIMDRDALCTASGAGGEYKTGSD